MFFDGRHPVVSKHQHKHKLAVQHKRLPEDEPSASKHVEDINKFKKLKIKILILKGAIPWFILRKYITMHGAKI